MKTNYLIYMLTACFIGGLIILQTGCKKDKDEEEASPAPSVPTTVVYDGQTYNILQIGTQYWLKENLNVGTMINGATSQPDNGQIEKYCYDNDATNCDTYGGLYQWNEMMQYSTQPGTQGICPTGWHIPTDDEWILLTNFLGGESVAGGKMKETDTLHWNSPNIGATNEYEFTALPGGVRFADGSFNHVGRYGIWWNSTENSDSTARDRYMANFDGMAYLDYSDKELGFSVRCIKDNDEITPFTVSTAAISDITETTATSGGSVTAQSSADVIERGVCWSTSNNPTIADLHTSDNTGTGSFVSLLTGLIPGTTYYVRAYATNSDYTILGSQVEFSTQGADFTATPVSGTAPLTVEFTDLSTNNPESWQWDFGDGGTSTEQNPSYTYYEAGIYTVLLLVSNGSGSDTMIKDNYLTVTSGGGGDPCSGILEVTYEGETYNTVEIGDQCWFKENLKTTQYQNGTPIEYPGSDNSAWENNTNGAYAWYDNDITYKDLYGALYNGHAVINANGLCPAGWHVPTDVESKILEGTVDSQYEVGDPIWDSMGYRGYDVGKNLKSSTGWSGGVGTNLYGFGALPAGRRLTEGQYDSGGGVGGWSTSSSYFNGLRSRYLVASQEGSYSQWDSFTIGRPVRCIKDN